MANIVQTKPVQVIAPRKVRFFSVPTIANLPDRDNTAGETIDVVIVDE